MTTHDVPYDLCHVPLHRLNTPATKLWFIGEMHRQNMAQALARRYRSGVGVLTRSLYLIAFVAPNGTIRELTAPLRQFEIWQIANRPGPGDCPCSLFHDPESQGPWMGNPKSQHHHHPLCQFEQTAVRVWHEAKRRAVERVKHGLNPQARPDEWERIRQEYRGR